MSLSRVSGSFSKVSSLAFANSGALGSLGIRFKSAPVAVETILPKFPQEKLQERIRAKEERLQRERAEATKQITEAKRAQVFDTFAPGDVADFFDTKSKSVLVGVCVPKEEKDSQDPRTAVFVTSNGARYSVFPPQIITQWPKSAQLSTEKLAQLEQNVASSQSKDVARVLNQIAREARSDYQNFAVFPGEVAQRLFPGEEGAAVDAEKVYIASRLLAQSPLFRRGTPFGGFLAATNAGNRQKLIQKLTKSTQQLQSQTIAEIKAGEFWPLVQALGLYALQGVELSQRPAAFRNASGERSKAIAKSVLRALAKPTTSESALSVLNELGIMQKAQ